MSNYFSIFRKFFKNSKRKIKGQPFLGFNLTLEGGAIKLLSFMSWMWGLDGILGDISFAMLDPIHWPKGHSLSDWYSECTFGRGAECGASPEPNICAATKSWCVLSTKRRRAWQSIFSTPLTQGYKSAALTSLSLCTHTNTWERNFLLAEQTHPPALQVKSYTRGEEKAKSTKRFLGWRIGAGGSRAFIYDVARWSVMISPFGGVKRDLSCVNATGTNAIAQNIASSFQPREFFIYRERKRVHSGTDLRGWFYFYCCDLQKDDLGS